MRDNLSKPMWSVCKKELRQFFSSLTGYIAIIVFLLVNGVMLFVFENNILDFGYATLDRFFQLAPWILLLLIPAITMRRHSRLDVITGAFLASSPWIFGFAEYQWHPYLLLGCFQMLLAVFTKTHSQRRHHRHQRAQVHQ